MAAKKQDNKSKSTAKTAAPAKKGATGKSAPAKSTGKKK